MKESNKNGDYISTYLSFALGNELFAANVKQVLNILEMKPITKVPHSPEYMKGVINLRGNVLPVIDFRIKFGLPDKKITKDTCIIVLKVKLGDEFVLVGALVDAVKEVIEINMNKVEAAPTIGTKYKAEFIHGMLKHNESFIMLLNIDLVLTENEILHVKDAQQDQMETINN